MLIMYFLFQFALINAKPDYTAQNEENENIAKEKYETRDSFTLMNIEILQYVKTIYAYISELERKKSNLQQATESCAQNAAPSKSLNKKNNDSYMSERQKKEKIKRYLRQYIMYKFVDDTNITLLEECFGMPLFYIEAYLEYKNISLIRNCSANERHKQKNINVDCEESKKSIYAGDWVQQKEDSDFLVNFIYCYMYDIKKLPQLIFDYMLNKEIKRLETMSTTKNNIVTDSDESVTEALNEGDIIEQKNKSTKTKKVFNCFKNKKTANTEDRKYKTEAIPKNNTKNLDNVTNHLLFKRSYTGLMEQLIKMLKDDSSLHKILIQNSEAFIAKYTQDQSFHLMLILRNCILAAKHEVLQQETIMFYEQALQNYTIECQKNNKNYANKLYKTILTMQLNNKSKKLKLLYINWSKDNRKS